MQYPLLFKAPPAKPFLAQATFPARELIASAVDQNGKHIDIRPIARTRGGWITHEVCARAAAGQREVIVSPGSSSDGAEFRMHHLARLAQQLHYVDIEFTDAQGTQRFSLTGTGVRDWHRWGYLDRQSYQHRKLGRFGWIHYWIRVRDGSDQLDFVLNWHNGVPGPDRLVTSARIVCSDGWVSTLTDPSCDTGYLIEPGNHVIPQQFNRPFRFSIPVGEEIPVDPEFLGIGDWSQGGFLPGAFKVPSLSGVNHAPALAAARASLSAVAPDPSYANQPVSSLWPARGTQNPSEGGGVDRLPMLGVQWASSGDPAALELYRINQLRDACRARRRYDVDGEPARLVGPKTWEFYDGFLRGRDAPWEWDRFMPLQAAADPRVFADHGMETHVRSMNDNAALKWLANDPLADRYIRESCSRARLQCWDDDIRVPARQHLGSTSGSDLGQAGLAIALGRCIGVQGLDRWAGAFAAHFRASQMPSGVLHAQNGQYPSDRFPFLDRYLLSGSELFTIATLALYQMGNADDVVRKCATGALHLFTDDDEPGLYYYTPVGPRDGSDTRYVTDDDWPEDLAEGMESHEATSAAYYTSWNHGLACATALAVGAPEAEEIIRRFTFGADPKAWGLVAPSLQTNAPVEQWYPILAP